MSLTDIRLLRFCGIIIYLCDKLIGSLADRHTLFLYETLWF